jgi:hypothetical protein
MKLAKYWVRGSGSANGVTVNCRGWSNDSESDARRKAEQTAEAIARRIASGRRAPGEYEYGDRPLPEPLLEELPGAWITRNSYGAWVLNCSSLLFLDVDREEPAQVALDIFSGLRSLFGKAPASPKQPDAVVSMEAVAKRHNLGLRVYRTAAGFRGIVTNLRFQPGAAETRQLLTEFGCDPLYIRLCQAQESFRARLTPKPWRCGLAAPPVSFPFEGPREEELFRSWLSQYRSNSAANATCRLLHTVGQPATDEEITRLIERHDRETKALSQLPLA